MLPAMNSEEIFCISFGPSIPIKTEEWSIAHIWPL
jgi:hypothetical protein